MPTPVSASCSLISGCLKKKKEKETKERGPKRFGRGTTREEHETTGTWSCPFVLVYYHKRIVPFSKAGCRPFVLPSSDRFVLVGGRRRLLFFVLPYPSAFSRVFPSLNTYRGNVIPSRRVGFPFERRTGERLSLSAELARAYAIHRYLFFSFSLPFLDLAPYALLLVVCVGKEKKGHLPCLVFCLSSRDSNRREPISDSSIEVDAVCRQHLFPATPSPTALRVTLSFCLFS